MSKKILKFIIKWEKYLVLISCFAIFSLTLGIISQMDKKESVSKNEMFSLAAPTPTSVKKTVKKPEVESPKTYNFGGGITHFNDSTTACNLTGHTVESRNGVKYVDGHIAIAVATKSFSNKQASCLKVVDSKYNNYDKFIIVDKCIACNRDDHIDIWTE